MTELPLTRPKEQKSDYIGTDTAYVDAGTIRAEIVPVSDSAEAERYGTDIRRSVMLLCEAGTDIRERDRVRLGNATYEIKGVTAYGNIRKAAAETI